LKLLLHVLAISNVAEQYGEVPRTRTGMHFHGSIGNNGQSLKMLRASALHGSAVAGFKDGPRDTRKDLQKGFPDHFISISPKIAESGIVYVCEPEGAIQSIEAIRAAVHDDRQSSPGFSKRLFRPLALRYVDPGADDVFDTTLRIQKGGICPGDPESASISEQPVILVPVGKPSRSEFVKCFDNTGTLILRNQELPKTSLL
jgi:hypothetical protein